MVRCVVRIPIVHVVEIMAMVSKLARAPGRLMAIVRIKTRLAVIHHKVWVRGQSFLSMG